MSRFHFLFSCYFPVVLLKKSLISIRKSTITAWCIKKVIISIWKISSQTTNHITLHCITLQYISLWYIFTHRFLCEYIKYIKWNAYNNTNILLFIIKYFTGSFFISPNCSCTCFMPPKLNIAETNMNACTNSWVQIIQILIVEQFIHYIHFIITTIYLRL